MKNTLLVVLFCAAILSSGCATSHTHSPAWEYKVVRGRVYDDSSNGLEAAINKAAADGWVVVSASSRSNTDDYGFAVMKRAKK